MASQQPFSNMSNDEHSKPLFTNLSAEESSDVTEMDSLCLRCHEQGTTRLLLTKIPFFKEIVISSFSCSHCGEENSCLQSAGEVQDKGIRLTVQVTCSEDLNRQIVKSEYSTFQIPHLDFEQPPVNREGEISTIEGLIQKAINGLTYLQPERRVEHPEVAEKIDGFISKMEELKKVQEPFLVRLVDPSGNSFIENIHAPKKDPNMTVDHFKRTASQDNLLGMETQEPNEEIEEGDAGQPFEDAERGKLDLKKEVLEFPYTCPNCSTPGYTRMKVVDIPYFKEVVLMATLCEDCGYRDNEVKGGAGIEPYGTRITLNVTKSEDLTRDLLKSDHCAVKIPSLDMELGEGTLGGKFTTVEGLLSDIKNQLSSSSALGFGFFGDSSTDTKKDLLNQLLDKLDKMIAGELFNYTLTLDDATGNSYMQNLNAPDPDPRLTVEKFERSEEQKDAIGILQMNTENY